MVKVDFSWNRLSARAFNAGSFFALILLPALTMPAHAEPAKPKLSGGVQVATPARAGAPTSIFATGLQAYQAGRYNEAAAYMFDSITKEGAGANAWLYMAHSYYALGQRKHAEESYMRLRDNFPGTPQAAMATQYILKLNPNADKVSTIPAEAAGNMAKAISAAKLGGTKEGLKVLRKRLTLVKPVYGHDPVSPATVKAVDACFDKIPASVQAILYENNIQFVITPTMIDKYPAGAYQEVAGYDGGSLKSCPGLFNGTEVVISQATVNEATDVVRRAIPLADLEGTFLHETGHALDSCLNQYSESEEFRHNYYLDIAHVPDDVAPRIKYYLQKSVRGQHETCAELTSILLGNQRDNYQDLINCFPHTMPFIKKKLGL